MYAFLLGSSVYILRLKSLYHIMYVLSDAVNTANQFSKVVVPTYALIINRWEFHGLMLSVFSIPFILVDVL